MPRTAIFLVVSATLLSALGVLLGVNQWRRRGLPGWAAVPLSTAAAQPAAAALFSGGLLLVWAGQILYATQTPAWRLLIWSLMGGGAAAFLLGGQLALRRSLPGCIVYATRRAAVAFGVRPYQLVLLGFALPFALLVRPAAGEALAARFPWTATLCWLIAVGCAVAGAWRSGAASMARPRLGFLTTLLLLGLALTALLVRVLALTDYPPTLSGDEGSAGLVAVQFLDGRANNLFTLGWFSFPSLFFFVQGLGIGLVGQTVEGLRLSSAVAGAATVVAVFWLGTVLYGRLTGWIAAGYLAMAHYHVHMSRIGLNNVWDGLFTALVLGGLWDGWRTGRRSRFLLTGAALGLAQYFYVTTRVLPLLLLLWAGAALLANRARFRQRLADLVLAAYAALIVYLPLALFWTQHPDEFQAPLQRVAVLGPWLEFETALTGRSGLAIVLELMATTALGFTHEPLRLLYDPGAPLLIGGAAALFLIGLLWLGARFDLRALLLLLPLLAVVVLGGFSQSPPASQRFILAVPVVAVILARPLAEAAQWLVEAWPRLCYGILAAVFLAVSLMGATDLRYYFLDVYDEYVLGGGNTETATTIARFLQGQDETEQTVYFFGLPRMGYYSLSTIPYLAPGMDGIDVVEPLTAPPAWPAARGSIFIFLPERSAELALVEQSFPGGQAGVATRPNGDIDFTFYLLETGPDE